MSYESSDIKILDTVEVDERFLWKKADALSKKYHVPVSCIQRGLEASERLGIPYDYYIERYLDKSDVGLMQEFTDVYEEILKGN